MPEVDVAGDVELKAAMTLLSQLENWKSKYWFNVKYTIPEVVLLNRTPQYHEAYRQSVIAGLEDRRSSSSKQPRAAGIA